jgi:hypothetical protein
MKSTRPRLLRLGTDATVFTDVRENPSRRPRRAGVAPGWGGWIANPSPAAHAPLGGWVA